MIRLLDAPTEIQILAARAAIELAEPIGKQMDEIVHAIAAWPLEDAADAPRRDKKRIKPRPQPQSD